MTTPMDRRRNARRRQLSGAHTADIEVISSQHRTTARMIRRCANCKARCRHVVDVFSYYDPISTCCRCGFSGRRRGEKIMQKAAVIARSKWAHATTWATAVDLALRGVWRRP